MNPIYSTRVTATGGRDGKVVSEDGVLQVEVRVPKEMGGAGGSYTNPEQLFAAGYAACFDSALNFVALKQKLRIQSSITATVTLNTTESGAFELSVLLEASIEGVDRETAQKLLEQAHATCPYSRATRNNVDVQVKLL
jgi:lipoyl-dependent peroxiredoxin